MQHCKCGSTMEMLWCWDDDQLTDHAFNLYGCENCGRILKYDVAVDMGQTWLGLTGVEEGRMRLILETEAERRYREIKEACK